ncbi:LysR family transcriptional regulator [Bacillus swezeyi]|uniref:HTH lysR-type domain-containing protein n=1 Tax=Bacillus swezeyi TaxID=1925020 RepID=A0A1R1QBK2_9BACI|nr:LysR family transcriptional regulator [Bacillus swezeyi]MEC1262258.1 LysR family transcriptional regulator [Bacillus swezeyi]MED2927174.1 LysR family transcriptional regulator [Bacillus swezeyi]MED2962372.1 LysR family transcriptional regulator [Bacillus swezeyi]MED3072173.1 LysR family transcriptional regulator [Bacillus swezeyi]MED3084342.1 LysR family transcriptional regulator [Bacillus swezeyi]
MSLQRYEIFNKVVQLQNISKAASELHLTQPGISNAIKTLEEDLGLKLLVRNRTGISLTREGEKIYDYSLKISKLNDALFQEASALRGLGTGVINVGSFASVTANWMPFIIKRFNEKYPGITVKIYEDDYFNLEKAVLSGELDCCFNTYVSTKGISFTPLVKDKLYCIVSLKNQLSKHNKIKPSQLEEFPLIKPKKGWDNEVAAFFKEHNIQQKVRYEVSDDHSILALVEANLGINIRPELVLKGARNKIKAIELEKNTYRTIGICTMPQVSHATKVFVETVKELYPKMNE